jgi:glycosyltransferase involved in cell wall biosynthesis
MAAPFPSARLASPSAALRMSQLPKIACLCPTFNRPALLAEALESFLRQTYPADRRELIILDDAGQYREQFGPNWHLISVGRRFRTLGEKRNATAGLASADAQVYAVWDDDDIYLPRHLERLAEAIAAGAPWYIPERVWVHTPRQLNEQPAGGLFQGAWGFAREPFVAVGGYPAMQSGQDQGLVRRLRQAGVCPSAGPAAVAAGPPTYIYRWYTADRAHLSALGPAGYERRASEPIAPQCGPLEPRWSRDWEQFVARAEDGDTSVR